MEDKLKFIWEHRYTGWIMGIAGFAAAIRFIWHSPTPGVAVTVLGGVAAIMSIRQLSSWEKFFWTAMVFALLYAEVHSINVDRKEQNRHQLEDRAAQEANFRKIRDQQNSDFEATASGLKTAVHGLDATLKIATGTFQQTQPHAALQSTTFTIVNGPKPPAIFNSNTKYDFNFSFINNGSEQGLITKRLGRIYVALPDDQATQIEVAKKFEKAWKEASPPAKNLGVVQSGAPGFWTDQETISQDDENNLKFNGNTLYIVRRIEYRDATGTWWTDRCVHYQVEGKQMDLNILHPCFVLMNGRYRAKVH